MEIKNDKQNLEVCLWGRAVGWYLYKESSSWFLWRVGTSLYPSSWADLPLKWGDWLATHRCHQCRKAPNTAARLLLQGWWEAEEP